jgi:polyribonucleotide nucleotidyltransferase
VKVEVPDADVGLIIGKGGTTIKSIQETTGASIQIPPSGNADNPSVRTINITHPNEQGANAAKQQIEHVLSSKPSYAQNSGPQTSVQITVRVVLIFVCIASPFSMTLISCFVNRFQTRMSVCALGEEAVSLRKCNRRRELVFRSQANLHLGNHTVSQQSLEAKKVAVRCRP